MKRVHLFMALVTIGRVFTFPFMILLGAVCFLAQAVTDSFLWLREQVPEFFRLGWGHFADHLKLWRELSRPDYPHRGWLKESVERDTFWTYCAGVFRASWSWHWN